jgi:hypothetical protein
VGVGRREDGDRIVLVRGLRVGFEQVLGASHGRHVRATTQVIQGRLQFMAREQVAQPGHPIARIGGVAAVGVALGDGLEIVVRLHRRGQVAAA